MKNKIIKLIKSKFVRNVILMASGTAGAQAIAMIASPFITRLYGPEAYGLMGLFNSIIQVLIPVAALTYPVAIVLPKKDRDARGIARLSLLISVIISLIVFVIIILFNKPIGSAFNIGSISKYLYLIPIVIFFAGLAEVYLQWLIRTNQFHINAKIYIYRSIFVNGGRLGIGLYFPSAPVLIIISALEDFFRVIMINFSMRRSGQKLSLFSNRENIKWDHLKNLAKYYRDFPIFRSPQVLIERLSQNMPVIMLSFFFGPAVTGFYTIGRTVLAMPSQLIGESVGNVFYPKISEASNEGKNLTPLIIKSTIALGAVGIIPFGIIMIFGPKLFSWVFGSEWFIAGEYARWMGFWVFCMFLNRTCTKALPVMFAQSFQLKYSIFTFVVRFLSFILGYYLFSDPLYAIAFFSLTAGLLSIGLILMTLKISKRFDVKH